MYEIYCGMIEFGVGVLIGFDMIFCIYFMIKLIILVVVMMLYEEGVICFDYEILCYIFEFVDM